MLVSVSHLSPSTPDMRFEVSGPWALVLGPQSFSRNMFELRDITCSTTPTVTVVVVEQTNNRTLPKSENILSSIIVKAPPVFSVI